VQVIGSEGPGWAAAFAYSVRAAMAAWPLHPTTAMPALRATRLGLCPASGKASAATPGSAPGPLDEKVGSRIGCPAARSFARPRAQPPVPFPGRAHARARPPAGKPPRPAESPLLPAPPSHRHPRLHGRDADLAGSCLRAGRGPGARLVRHRPRRHPHLRRPPRRDQAHAKVRPRLARRRGRSPHGSRSLGPLRGPGSRLSFGLG
jgi:hypothetical protein